jgi:hypothetical protein
MPTRKEAEAKLVSIINASLEKEGKILIPVPSVGRAQEILLVLDGYMKQGLLKETHVYIEGMVNEATAITTAYPEYLAREVKDLIFHKEVNPFQSDYFVKVKDAGTRQEAMHGGPAVILATSGMLEGGPSVEYFKELASGENNALVFVSYQIEGTLGHRVQKGLLEAPILTSEGKVNIIKIELRVESVEGFSGHSDRNQILSYLRKISPRPERVIVNHGEKSKCLSMADTIRKIFEVDAYAPQVLETIRLK